MHNNTYRNQQLLRDKLFLERVFLLDIEQLPEADGTDEVSLSMPQGTREQSNISKHSHKSSIAPISFVSIYAVVVTLLLLLPSNRERANSKTIVVERENEQIKLLSTKLQQIQAQTQSIELQIAAQSEQKPVPVVKTIEPVTSSTEQASVKPKVTYTFEGNQLPEHGNLLPVPAPPPFVEQTSLPPIFVDTVAKAEFVEIEPAFYDASEAPGAEPEKELKPQVKSEAIVDEEIPESQPEPLGQWLGQTDAVYYSYSFHHHDEGEVEQQSLTSVSEDIAQIEQTLPKDEDLKQYLMSTPLSNDESKVEEQTSNSISENLTEAEQPLLENEDLEQHLESTPVSIDDEAEAEKQLASSISDDEDLEHYLDATPLFEVESDQEEELLGVSSESPISQAQSLFDDEDLARYLNSGTLFDDDILKQKLGTAQESPTRAALETEAEIPEAAVREKVTPELQSEPLVSSAASDRWSTERSSEENIAQLSSTLEHGDESQAEQPLFADEDLRQFLSSTPLFSDDIIKTRFALDSY